MIFYSSHKKNGRQKGFTLAEMAIVILVIGLLASLILKSQELIANAQITSTISELENLGGAVNSFQSTYGVYPGDMSNATFRLQNCAGGTCNDGNGDGEINVAMGVANTTTDEAAYFFGHLRAAELISNIDGTNSATFGNAFPRAPVGGGYIVGDTNVVGESGFDLTEMREGVYLIIVNTNEDVDGDTGVLSPAQAETIDRILDDGRPDTGGIVGQIDADSCRNTDTPVGYAENEVDQMCVIAVRLPRPDLRP